MAEGRLSRFRGLKLICPACRMGVTPDAAGVRCLRCGAVYPEKQGILHLVAGRSGAPGYDPHYFETLPEVESKHFWFVARQQMILDALRRTVPDLAERPLFDIGCGTGGLLSFLAEAGVRVAGACDAYPQALELAVGRLDIPLLLVDEGRLPPLAPGQAMLGLFDVLEHLDDDRAVLAWIHSVLEPGGILVLTVPAHPFLFDEMDDLAGHRRRYRRVELREKLEGAGFEIRLLTHYMASLLPFLIVLRRAGRLLGRHASAAKRRDAELKVVPGVNGLFRAVLRLERFWIRAFSLPVGSSLIAVATRTSGQD